MPKKNIVPMLLVKNEEGKNVFYHLSDEVRASQYGEPKKVYVVMNSDYFVGTWQFEETIDGYTGCYSSEEKAKETLGFIEKVLKMS